MAAAAVGCGRPQAPAQHDFDIVISGGRIVDGTGSPWFRGDVGIQADRIKAIGDLSSATAQMRIDASGLIVAPGFIDMLGQSEFSVLVDNRAASKITQGITTEVTGEGTSIAPLNDRMVEAASSVYKHYGVTADWRTLAEYFKRLDERTHPAINIASFIGAGGLRRVVGDDRRRPPGN
jgi:dihydroorotase/N-acyl-D-amino-acid deacylase